VLDQIGRIRARAPAAWRGRIRPEDGMPKRSSPRHIGRGTHVTPRFGDILRKRACLMYIAVNDGNAVFHEKSPTTDHAESSTPSLHPAPQIPCRAKSNRPPDDD